MKTTIATAIAVTLLSLSSAHGQIIKGDTSANAAAGGAAGGATGAVVGGLVFGPIGAVIGGFTGAAIGAAGGVEATSVDYVRLNPTEPVVIQGDLDVGYAVPEEVELHVIEGDDKYGYFYTNDRAYFVDLSNRTVVYSPGIVVAAEAN
ncbi:DUF1236 domain-containing protein [Devosia rhizoryzae]|uniref:DUF1236 domain-containing protein n=1 Tax=Devosia rhizoryzae TaxID=2774137 RepID=A0ABX7C6W4_9HYPH|nr:DUF1236 domain-containing protein [Devosia rhizoryzae]QQR40005.1 DUF1236 domain-containing protein [Devosia rhizoryzae]